MDFTKEEVNALLYIWGNSSETALRNSARYSPNKIRNNAIYDQMWEQRYNELVAFWNKHGHTSVPQRYEPNVALGKWVHRQRHQLKKKLNREQSSLTQSRFEALQKIGFNIDPKSRSESSWLKRYRELAVFKSRHGHCNVPQKYSLNPSLGRWVHKQRHDLLKIQISADDETNALVKQRIGALNKIGFEWSLRLR